MIYPKTFLVEKYFVPNRTGMRPASPYACPTGIGPEVLLINGLYSLATQFRMHPPPLRRLESPSRGN